MINGQGISETFEVNLDHQETRPKIPPRIWVDWFGHSLSDLILSLLAPLISPWPSSGYNLERNLEYGHWISSGLSSGISSFWEGSCFHSNSQKIFNNQKSTFTKSQKLQCKVNIRWSGVKKKKDSFLQYYFKAFWVCIGVADQTHMYKVNFSPQLFEI